MFRQKQLSFNKKKVFWNIDCKNQSLEKTQILTLTCFWKCSNLWELVVEFKVAFKRSIKHVISWFFFPFYSYLSLARRTFFGRPLSTITFGCNYFGMQEFELQNQLSQILEKEYPNMTSDNKIGQLLIYFLPTSLVEYF